MEFAEELSAEDRDAFIEELAHKVVDRRMETPAIMFLEMHKPISFVASQAAIVASPFLVPLFGRDGVARYSRLFSSRENVELLIQRIEELADERETTEKARKKGEAE